MPASIGRNGGDLSRFYFSRLESPLRHILSPRVLEDRKEIVFFVAVPGCQFQNYQFFVTFVRPSKHIHVAYFSQDFEWAPSSNPVSCLYSKFVLEPEGYTLYFGEEYTINWTGTPFWISPHSSKSKPGIKEVPVPVVFCLLQNAFKTLPWTQRY